jgi:hypothetical protein
MRKLVLSAMAAAVVLSFPATFTPFAPVQKAEAMVIYQWCAYYGGRGGSGGAANCGFVTRAQCMATVSGTQGFCDVNPWWQDPPPSARRAKKVAPY